MRVRNDEAYSFTARMFILAVREINHKYIVVGGNKELYDLKVPNLSKTAEARLKEPAGKHHMGVKTLCPAVVGKVCSAAGTDSSFILNCAFIPGCL